MIDRFELKKLAARLCAASLLSTATLPAGAGVIFTGNFESGLDGWTTRQIAYRLWDQNVCPSPKQQYSCPGPAYWGNIVPSATYPTVPIRAGGKSMRFELRLNDPENIVHSIRTELVMDKGVPVGQERWYAFSIFVPDDDSYKVDTGKDCFEILAQWHHSNDSIIAPPLTLVTEGSTWWLDLANGDGKTSSKIAFAGDHGKIARGQWTDFIFHIRWTASASTDGKPTLQVYQRVPSQSSAYSLVASSTKATNYPNETADFKMGIYKWDWREGDSRRPHSTTTKRVVYHDEVRFSDTRNATIDTILGEIAPPPLASLGLPFADDFQGADAAKPFKVVDGNWQVVTDPFGSRVYQAVGAQARTVVGDKQWTNYTAQVKFKVNAWSAGDNSVGMLVRYVDPLNYYIFNYNASAGELRITKQVNGVFTRLAVMRNVHYPVGDASPNFIALGAKVDGSALSLSINGAIQLTATDASLLAGGVGLMHTNGDVSYDVFDVR